MTAHNKIDPNVLLAFTADGQTSRPSSISIIVTFQSGTFNTETQIRLLETNGLKITNVFQEISAVAGHATHQTVLALSKLQDIERIEFDSQMHTLES